MMGCKFCNVAMYTQLYYRQKINYNVVVMERLGLSLEDLLVSCSGTFSLNTTLSIADQLLRRLQDLHIAGFVHRDIKPENFLLGLGDKSNVIYVIDFGLSKRYKKDRGNEHIPYKDNKSLTGTARYASINAHRGIEQSRRDDLEALGHMLLYFLKGTLPWQGLPAKTKEEKYRKIREKKEETPIDTLCSELPESMKEYMKYCRSLPFTSEPDYDHLRGLFKKQRGSNSEPFDWDRKNNPSPNVDPKSSALGGRCGGGGMDAVRETKRDQDGTNYNSRNLNTQNNNTNHGSGEPNDHDADNKKALSGVVPGHEDRSRKHAERNSGAKKKMAAIRSKLCSCAAFQKLQSHDSAEA